MAKTKVLLIDDDEDFHLLLRRMLRRAEEGYILDVLSDYDAALSALEENTYDVYLVDYQLDHRSGIDLIRQATGNGVTKPIILVTGQDERQIDLEVLEAGAIDYIEKTVINARSLGRVIRHALHRAQNQHQLRAELAELRHHRDTIHQRDAYIAKLMVMLQVESELSHITNIDSVLALAIDAMMRLGSAHAGFIALNNENQKLRLVQLIGEAKHLSIGDYLPESTSVMQVMQLGESMLIDLPNHEEDTITLHSQSLTQIIMPMQSHEGVIGIISLETQKRHGLDADTVEFLNLTAGRIGVAVENARLYLIAQNQVNELKTLYDQVSRLEQLKTDMIRMAAHDLRNPINVILSSLTLIQRLQGQPDRQGEYMKTIEQSARRMQRIAEDILSLERIENNEQRQGTIFNLNKLIQSIFIDYAQQAQEKTQQFDLQLSDTDIHIKADRAQINEAVSNLIGNAIKYTPERGKITIKLSQRADKAIFTVEDNGYGIPEAQQAKLFQPFFRVQSEETRAIEGTGLGLYLIKNVIERFAGSMTFESTYGEGSVFGFRLPLAEESTP